MRESSIYWGIPFNKMHVVYNGVNLEQFYPDPEAGYALKESLNISGRIILYLGRVCEQKGTDILIEAYKILRSMRNDVQLVVGGPAGQFGNTEDNSLIKAINAAGGLYIGIVDETQLLSVYNMADIFVLPTRRYEMFGMVAIEAQACGKPVIASDHGGLKEVVPDECGFRFPVGDAKMLAERIALLLDNPVLYRSASEAARKNAYKYSWDVIASELRYIYKEKFR
jgi:glycosyltransferase involved in cell wall biosynthesis